MEVKITDTFTKKLLQNLKESPFRELGLLKNPFIPFIPKDIMSTFVNREKEKELLLRYLPDIIQGSMPLLVLGGSKGIGKTHFLNYICKELKDVEDIIEHKTRLLDADDFDDFFDEIEKNPIPDQQLIFIDDTEKVWENHKEKLVRLIDNYPTIKLICVWNQTKWHQIKTDPFYASLKPVCIKMEKLNNDHLIKIVMIRMAPTLLKSGGYPFDENALGTLADISDGVPYSMVYFSEKMLHYALDNNKKLIDSGLVEEYIHTLKLNQFNLKDITNSQWKILEALISITHSKKRGATSSEIAEEVGVSRPAIIAQIRGLGNVVEDKKSEQKKLYFIKPLMQGIIESHVAGEEI